MGGGGSGLEVQGNSSDRSPRSTQPEPSSEESRRRRGGADPFDLEDRAIGATRGETRTILRRRGHGNPNCEV